MTNRPLGRSLLASVIIFLRRDLFAMRDNRLCRPRAPLAGELWNRFICTQMYSISKRVVRLPNDSKRVLRWIIEIYYKIFPVVVLLTWSLRVWAVEMCGMQGVVIYICWGQMRVSSGGSKRGVVETAHGEPPGWNGARPRITIHAPPHWLRDPVLCDQSHLRSEFFTVFP